MHPTCSSLRRLMATSEERRKLTISELLRPHANALALGLSTTALSPPASSTCSLTNCLM
ncbi:exported hypothetical protein [Candidatus Sulfopaludibacter sp. SbA4]|nr:exported hypothetical protein [Candidatus Sulfopaludibacter sp. SbA4]